MKDLNTVQNQTQNSMAMSPFKTRFQKSDSRKTEIHLELGKDFGQEETTIMIYIVPSWV